MYGSSCWIVFVWVNFNLSTWSDANLINHCIESIDKLILKNKLKKIEGEFCIDHIYLKKIICNFDNMNHSNCFFINSVTHYVWHELWNF